MFQSGAPTFVQRAATFHEFEDKFDRPIDIATGVIPQNIKFDLKKPQDSPVAT